MFFTAQTQDLSSVVNMLDALLLVMLLGSGAYCLYTAIRLHRDLILFKNKFLYPGGCLPEDCVDEDGFINFMLPRLTIFGIMLVLLGVACGVWMAAFGSVQHWLVDAAKLLLPISAFAWYIVVQRKAAKLFW